LDESVSFLNMASLQYWAKLKKIRPAVLLQQGLALLFTNLETSLIPSIVGSGVTQQFLKNSSATFASFLSPAGIHNNNTDFMWSDRLYGLSDKKNVGFWTQSAVDCFENSQNSFTFSSGANTLKNYFALTDGQTKFLMEKMYGYVRSVTKLLLYNHYCAEVSEEECTGRYLAVAQISDGWVTSHTPPFSALIPKDTVCADNVTCEGKYP
jgi:hypothetical protein